MRVAVTRKIQDDQINRLRREVEVTFWDSDLPPDPNELDDLLENVDGALTLLTDPINADFLDRHPQLKVVSNLAVGYDNIDLDAATQRGVAVCTTPDVLTETTAEFTLALILAASRKLVEAVDFARRGEWKTWYPLGFLGKDLTGSTLGIVGLGRIGRRVAELGSRIGFNEVIYHDPRQDHDRFQPAEFEDLLQRSDVLSLHTPLTDATKHLIDANALELMKDDAILVNTARGGVIDTDALVQTLRDGRLFAVALDVTDPEPLPIDHPLYSFERVVITPHIASATLATRQRMAELAVENLLACLQGGEPPNCLNPEVLRGA